VKRALCVLALALPLAGQPKLLINAKADTQSAASGLEPAFRALVAAQPQPAWIGYSVPAVRTYGLGCEYVSRDNGSADGPGAGTVHLEPPDHAIILFRVVNNAVERIRSVSPNCEIDAGDVPFHWLNEVQPAQSVALLSSFVSDRQVSGNSALSSIAMHSDPAADAALDKFLAPSQPDAIRLRTASLMGSSRGKRGVEILKNLIANDPDERVRERAVNALGSSKEPEATDLLIDTVRNNQNARLRAQAVSDLARKPGANVPTVIAAAIQNDPDTNVKKRAVSALASVPDGQGIPTLIDLVKNAKTPEIRKEAMSALERTRDPRALTFFEQVLK
jgi:HEAT repeats